MSSITSVVHIFNIELCLYFRYTKVNRDDGTWTHQVELGWIKMENLLADSFYQNVLLPRGQCGESCDNKQSLLRIFCSEQPPGDVLCVVHCVDRPTITMSVTVTFLLALPW